MSPDSATARPARSAEGWKAQARWRRERPGSLAPAVPGREKDARVERLGLLAADWLGEFGCVAIAGLDPFDERFTNCGRDRRAAAARHGQPLVPTARRYSVT